MFLIKIILILILSLTHPFARSGFGYTIGFSSGGQFTLPKEVGISDEVDWIDYGSFMSGTLDYTHNNLIFSFNNFTKLFFFKVGFGILAKSENSFTKFSICFI